MSLFVSPWDTSTGIPSPTTFYIRDYLQTYGEANHANTWVFSCVRRIMQDAAQVPLRLYRGYEKKKKLIEKHAVVTVFRDINPQMSYFDFMEGVMAHLRLCGNVFMALENNKTELWLIRPDIIKIVPNAKGEVVGYIADYGGRKEAYLADEMLHFKEFAPTNAYWGLSPLAAARDGLIIDYSARVSHKAFYQNSALPSGILNVEAVLQEDQRDLVRAELLAKYTGMEKTGRPMILEGGVMKWQQVQLTPEDARYLASREFTKAEICAIEGVPPAMICDFSDSSVIQNTDNQLKIYWHNTLIPMLAKLQNFLSEHLLPKFGITDPDTYLEFDLSRVVALRDNEKEKAEIANLNVKQANIWTINEARERLWNMEPVEGGDTILVGFGLAPLDEVAAGGLLNTPPENSNEEDDSADPEDDKDPKKDEAVKAIGGAIAKAIEALDGAEKKRLSMWRKRMATTEPIELQWAVRLVRFFKHQADIIIEELTKQTREPQFQGNLEQLIETVTNINHVRGLGSLGKPYIQKAVQSGVKTAFQDLLDLDLNAHSPTVINFIEHQSLKYAKNVTDTSAGRLRTSLSKGIQAGETIDQLSERVKGILIDAAPARARSIARTETSGAFNFGTYEGFRQAGPDIVEGQEWLSARDQDVRDTHVAADGQRVKIAESFQVGGCSLRFPADQSAGCPGEIINCRCVAVPVLANQ